MVGNLTPIRPTSFSGRSDKTRKVIPTSSTPAAEEARLLFEMVERRSDTVEGVRELIAVPSEVEATLRKFAKRHPEERRGIERILEYRRRVLTEYEKLIASSKPLGVH
jgi:hypothetical protein